MIGGPIDVTDLLRKALWDRLAGWPVVVLGSPSAKSQFGQEYTEYRYIFSPPEQLKSNDSNDAWIQDTTDDVMARIRRDEPATGDRCCPVIRTGPEVTRGMSGEIKVFLRLHFVFNTDLAKALHVQA